MTDGRRKMSDPNAEALKSAKIAFFGVSIGTLLGLLLVFAIMQMPLVSNTIKLLMMGLDPAL
jgi:ABC-type nitrate/sulfonate/bicarbonate transport system permease component